MRTSSRLFIVICLAFVFGLVGCQQEGPAEKAGERVDNAAERAGQNMEKAGDTVADKTERAGDAIADKADQAGDAIANKADQAGDYLSDAAITAKVKADILNDPLLKMTQVEVTTTDGVVKLSGTVDSQESIDRAVEIARNHENVKSVDNGLVH